MTIHKVIEVLELELKSAELQTDPDFYKALKIAIACLKRHRDLRQHGILNPSLLLPGETRA